ncbi:MAG: hypothetical protein ACRC9P_00205 [Bacteroides sp.]
MTFQTPARVAGTHLDVFETEVLRLMAQQQYAEAYLLLERLTNPSLSNLYNLALCLYFSKEYSTCLLFLAKAQAKLPSYSLRHTRISPLGQKVLHQHLDQATYLHAVSEVYCTHFPNILQESILRLRIDCLLRLARWKELIATASQLKYKSYSQVLQAVAEAQKKRV